MIGLRGGPRQRGIGPTNPDVIRATDVAQRTGTIIYKLFFPGVGARSRNMWEATSGQNAIARLSDETGGEAFFLGVASAPAQETAHGRPVSGFLGDYSKLLPDTGNGDLLLYLRDANALKNYHKFIFDDPTSLL